MKKILILFVSLCFCVTLFAQKKIKVACVGNSITYGYTLPDRETNAYPAKLQKIPEPDYEISFPDVPPIPVQMHSTGKLVLMLLLSAVPPEKHRAAKMY